MDSDWTKNHRVVIDKFLKYLNGTNSNYILKGGTALLLCYNLDRFSEDIDLDSNGSSNIKRIVNDFCKENNFSYRIAKDTIYVNRFLIHYNDMNKPLKIEVSNRNRKVDENSYTSINNISVYNINKLCVMKAVAYNARDKIRDLYDITFICNNYWNELATETKEFVKMNLEYKGIEQFDYLINTQKDELIDKEKLSNDFVTLFDKFGLLFDDMEY